MDVRDRSQLLVIGQFLFSNMDVHQISSLFGLSFLLCKFVLQLIGRLLDLLSSGKFSCV